MNADRRIVPEKHISYLLEEEHISERTKAIKHRLIRSPKKIDKVAEHWIESTGINSLARIMLKNVSQVPHTHTTTLIETTKDSHIVTAVVTPPDIVHTVHTRGGNTHHHTAHDDHHGAVPHHTPDHSHQESRASHHTEHEHGDHHDTHGHNHHDDHGNHGHGHEHHGGNFSSFISSGHWCGDQGARIFAMVGRIIGEIIGYIFKALVLAMLFGPTRTALLVLFISIFLNNTMDTSLPIGIAASIAGIIHLIFTGISMIGGSGGHGEGGHGGGHGHH